MCMFLDVMWRNLKMRKIDFSFFLNVRCGVPITYLPAVYTGSHMGATCEGVKVSNNLTKPHEAALNF